MIRKKVYGLVCPIDGKIKYIGCSVNPKQRLVAHMVNNPSDCTPNKHMWINKLRAKKLKPVIQILETVNGSDHIEREKFWIKYHRAKCIVLLNRTHYRTPSENSAVLKRNRK